MGHLRGGGRHVTRTTTPRPQTRAMGGGGHAYMEGGTDFGTKLGEVFGTICWLWVFHRMSQDGRVLLGYEHPWEHGGGGETDLYEQQLRVQGNMHPLGRVAKQTSDAMVANWETFNGKAINPGDDDDDDDDDDDEDDDEEEEDDDDDDDDDE